MPCWAHPPVSVATEVAGKKSTAKHLADTSVVISFLLGTAAAKKVYRRLLPGARYVSKYVSLEFHAACLRRLVEAYFVMDMPQISTIDDGIRYLAHSYKPRQLSMSVNAVGMIARLAALRDLRTDDPADKDRLLEAFGECIMRLASVFDRGFKNTGVDGARCARTAIVLKREFDRQKSALREFATAFDEWRSCYAKCDIEGFFLSRRKHRMAVDRLCTEGAKYQKAEDKGFKDIRNKLQEIVATERGPTSCQKCSALGDAIITLDAPSNMEIVHIDKSFNALCEILHKQHRQLPSVVRATKDAPPGN